MIKTFLSENAVEKENIRSTAHGKMWSFFVGVKIGTNEIQKVLNKGKTGDETKSEK